MSIFKDIIISKEAVEYKLKIYPSDYEKFCEVIRAVNEKLTEGSVKEEEIFSKMLHHALKGYVPEKKTGKKIVKKNLRSEEVEERGGLIN